MIDDNTLFSFKKWFKIYTSSFKSDIPHYNLNFNLKIEHSYRVCFEILDIGKSLGLTHQELNLAEMIALFHDIGRFEQFMRFGTFSDSKSIDHALLSIKVLNKNSMFDKLDRKAKKVIYKSIYNHNKLVTSDKNLTEQQEVFMKMIRDADKLDILYIFSDYYEKRDKESNSAAELDLPDTDFISESFFYNIMNLKPIKYSDLKSLTEFKLLKFGWVYDLNFKRSFEIIKERGFLESIYNTLPKIEKVESVYKKVNEFLVEKISSCSCI